MSSESDSGGAGSFDAPERLRINPGSELPDRLRELIERAPLRRLAAGEVLMHPGALQDRVWWLQSGALRRFSLGADGSEFTHDFVGPGEWAWGALRLGAEDCCVEAGPGLAALAACQVRTLEVDALQRLRGSDAASADYVLTLLLRASARRLQREADLVHRSAEQRYQDLLDQRPDIEAELSQKQIALWLGITPVALSRIRRRRADGR
ncbi:MAG: Crp/Fnr family transcriptional regulator [Xanthomonadales bacterium]|nr:Crp/Fnr family transcriptional regulator [Xanthomonadales bacterium]